MSEKHCAQGSSCPAPVDGKLRIYGMRFCPFTERVVLVAEAKNIPYELVFINLASKPDWYLQKNPSGKVPAIELPSGDILYDSGIVTDFLDEYYDNAALCSKCALQKAKDRLVVENFGKLCGLFYRAIYGKGSEEEVKSAIVEYEEYVETLGKELARRGSAYFGGSDKPGMVDYMIWPWFERRPLTKLFHPQAINYEDNCIKPNIKIMEDWILRMQKTPAVAKYMLSPEIHFKHSKSVVDGNPQYDILA